MQTNHEVTLDPLDRHIWGVKAPIVGKRWGCTRNISQRAINRYWEVKANEREEAIATRREAA
jgi:hypothetical protein